jgi:hypothetical protein
MTEEEKATITKEEEEDLYKGYIEEITELLNSNIDEKNRIYQLPINKINNICINKISLQVNEEMIYLSIDAQGFNDTVFNEYYTIDARITNDLMKQIFNVIKCLKWDNLHCRFHFRRELNQDEEKLTNLFNNIFKDDSNIETTIKECVVCYNNTKCKTNECNHCVCLECAQKLYGGEDFFHCPYCREECYSLERRD